MRFTEISKGENDRFSKTHPKGHIFQSSRWATVKGHWETRYVGGYDDGGQLVLACVMLVRSILPARIVYIPRGPVCAYGDHSLLRGFIEYLTAYCRENRISFMILDPDVPVRINGIPEKTGEAAAQTLRRCGLKQKRTNGFEQIQAGSVYRIRWEHQGTSSGTCEKIFEGFDKKTRYNIRVARRRGLSVEICDRSALTADHMDAFCRLMEQTGRRDHFIPRDRDYFLNMMERLYPNAKLFLVRYDPRLDLRRTREEMAALRETLTMHDARCEKNPAPDDKELAKREQITERLAGLRKRCERIAPMLNQGDIYLSGSIMAYWGDKSWYMYGASADYCRDTMPNYLMQWEMIRYGVRLGLNMYDLRGVPAAPDPDDPLYGLYRFKKGFGGDLEEFPGSFYLVRNHLIYWLYCAAFTRFKTVRSVSMRLFTRIKGFLRIGAKDRMTVIEEDA